jgi:hypothetical protein
MQGTSRIYVSDYSFNSQVSGDAIAKLAASGNAKDRAEAIQLQARFADSQRFRLKPRDANSVSRDHEYPYHFELDTELVNPGKSAKAAAASGSNSSKAK